MGKMMKTIDELKSAAIQAAESWATAESAHAKSIGAGGPGCVSRVDKAENVARAAIDALTARAK